MSAGRPLSSRQQEILRLLSLGRSNKQIADQLGLATGTVKQHVYALFRKLGVTNRTMAVVKGGARVAQAEDAEAAPEANAAPPGAVRYARRLVTAVVVEPRTTAARDSHEAANIKRQVGALRKRVAALAEAFDARAELLAGGGVAAWFGQSVAHGDDAERAVAFVRMLQGGAPSAVAFTAGIGSVAEVLGDGDQGAVAYLTFRVATMLASLAQPGAPLACALTAELAGLAAAEGGEASGELPPGAVLVGPAPAPSSSVADRWGGLPFLAELVATAQRRRCQWVAIESWPPEAGTRLMDAIGECLAARGLAVSRLWLPAPSSAGPVAPRLIGQLRADVGPAAAAEPAALVETFEQLAALSGGGPVALVAYGLDALPVLKLALGADGMERLRALPLVIVAGAMHRSGAPQTVVRLLGAQPGASPFVRVLRMQVPAEKALPQGMRPDVQAVLDGVSAEARAVARMAADPEHCDLAAVAQSLALPVQAVIERCQELERAGLVSVGNGQVLFRDAATAAAVRASLA